MEIAIFNFLGVLPLPIWGVVAGSTGWRFLFSILRGTSVTYLWGGRWKYGQEIAIFNFLGVLPLPIWGVVAGSTGGRLLFSILTCTSNIHIMIQNKTALTTVNAVLLSRNFSTAPSIKFYSSSPFGPS